METRTETSTSQPNLLRQRHDIHRVRFAEDDATQMASAVAIISHIKTDVTPSINWTLLMYNAEEEVTFFNAVRKDWIVEKVGDDTLCLKVDCQADPGYQHTYWLEFSCDILASLFHKDIKQAIAVSAIDSAWDDTVEDLTEVLLDLITDSIGSSFNPRASLTVLEDDSTVYMQENVVQRFSRWLWAVVSAGLGFSL